MQHKTRANRQDTRFVKIKMVGVDMMPITVFSKKIKLLVSFAMTLAFCCALKANPESYSAPTPPPLRVIFDYYHRILPKTKVGNHLITGSWVDNVGRYSWDDFVHTNSFDPVFVALGKEFDVRMSREPIAARLTECADAIVLLCPENPRKAPEVPVISDEEIAAITKFVNDGGSLMILINSGTIGRSNEDFESIQLRKLVRSFGLDWNDDDTNYSNIEIGDEHPFFYDVPVFHYGSGCSLKILPDAQRATVLMDIYSDSGYPELNVRGPGIVMVRPGKGKVILVGDIGSWTANLSRPWAENERVMKQLFRYLKPDKGVSQPQLEAGQSWTYDVEVGGLQAFPVENTLGQIERPHYRMFFPRPITGMPYIEATASLHLKCLERTEDQASRLEAEVAGFRWFDEPDVLKEDNVLRFTASRQGKVSGIEAKGRNAQWLAAEVPALVALLPVDGIRPGDCWESLEPVRIPIIQGAGLAPVKTITMDVIYAKDTEIDGRECRLLRASGELWLDSLGVRIEDLLPDDEIRRVGGTHYKFFNGRGGKLLYKREQWVDSKSGIVLKSRMQTRIVAWVQDLDIPIGISNIEKDHSMVISLAQTVKFTLR